MSIRTEDVYRSSNGDRWQLLHDSLSQLIIVRHVPNASSGGIATEIPVDDFLRINGPGPEFVALRRALEAWLPAASTGRSAGFFWVQGPERPEPAYWDGARWSLLSPVTANPVTANPVVLAETPLRFDDGE